MANSQLITPWTDPENSVRATSVNQMYDVRLPLLTFNFQHDVGSTVQIPSFKILIRNKTLNADLLINISLPPYLTSNARFEFVVAKGLVYGWDVVPHTSFITERCKIDISQIISDISITAKPINYFGPIYVNTNLPSLG